MDDNDEDEVINSAVEEGMRQTENYINYLSEIIKKIEKFQPKDRVDHALLLARCLNGMAYSIKGWGSWLNNLEILNTLSLEDLKLICPKIREVAMIFLNADIEVTRRKLGEAKEKTKTKGKKKTTYVS